MEPLVTCCGFGHRVMLMDIEKPLRAVLERLVEDRGVRVFYTGGMGEFDKLFARTVRCMKRDCSSFRLVLVAPYLTQKIAMGKKEDGTMYGGQIARATSEGSGRCWHEAQYDEILIPAELEGVHPKAAIGLRNRWMVDRSDIVIAALHRDFGGADFCRVKVAHNVRRYNDRNERLKGVLNCACNQKLL